MTNLVLDKLNIPTEAEIKELQDLLINSDPSMFIESFKTEHDFNGGMYCRRMEIQKGTLVVGKTHKTDHFFICAKGSGIIWTSSSVHKIEAGDVINSPVGTKRVVYATEDMVCITMHKTDKTSTDGLEENIVESDNSIYDIDNKLKEGLQCLG